VVVTLGHQFGAIRDYPAHREYETLEIAAGWQFLPGRLPRFTTARDTGPTVIQHGDAA
jgi:hypothetical protein